MKHAALLCVSSGVVALAVLLLSGAGDPEQSGALIDVSDQDALAALAYVEGHLREGELIRVDARYSRFEGRPFIDVREVSKLRGPAPLLHRYRSAEPNAVLLLLDENGEALASYPFASPSMAGEDESAARIRLSVPASPGTARIELMDLRSELVASAKVADAP